MYYGFQVVLHLWFYFGTFLGLVCGGLQPNLMFRTTEL